jgi:ribulose-5-phosphate 4-epimerase/fuculose-1-phosphate aldolase
VNRAGFVVHSAVHLVREDAGCVIHLHTRDGVAVSAMKEGLLPLSQTALTFFHDVAYHDFEGVVLDLQERERLAADLGTRNLMLLRNHGTLTLGRSVAAAFYRMYALEWACATQVRALSMGRELQFPAGDVQEQLTEALKRGGIEPFAENTLWPAMLRKVARECPGFDD